MILFLLKHKNLITNYTGFIGGLILAILSVFREFNLALPAGLNLTLGITGGLCLGITGWYQGKNLQDYFKGNNDGNEGT